MIAITLGGTYGLLILFFFFEGRLRQGEAARSREAGEHDRSSTNTVGAAFGLGLLCLLLAPLLDYFEIGAIIPSALAWAGLVLAAGGLGQPYRDYQKRTKRLIPFIY